MKLYTAIGKYEFRKDADGNKLPVIIANETEYTLDPWEMILWSSLIWNILTCDEVRKIFYAKEREVHILGELPCESYIDSLERKGLIVSGHGITAVDALHDLLSGLYVIQIRANLLSKTTAFLHLTFMKQIPYKVTKHIFDNPQFSVTESKVMKLAEQNRFNHDFSNSKNSQFRKLSNCESSWYSVKSSENISPQKQTIRPIPLISG